ncbi:hypothetical protein MASR1M60_17920 [Rhodocyclaceae bacterium]
MASPEERATRKSRERKRVHELLLWRLEKASDAVEKAATEGREDLEDIARRALAED